MHIAIKGVHSLGRSIGYSLCAVRPLLLPTASASASAPRTQQLYGWSRSMHLTNRIGSASSDESTASSGKPSGPHYSVHHPTTGELVHTVQASTSADIQSAIAAASAAQKKWAKTPVSQRRDVFLKAAEMILDESNGWRKSLIESNIQETECTRPWAELQMSWMHGQLRELAGALGTALKAEMIATDEGNSTLLTREPYGVCFSMAAWNAVFALTNRAVATPLLTGNAVLMKTTEMTPRTQQLWVEFLCAAGLPEGIVQIVHIDPKDAPKLVEEIIADNRIRHINFTGSTRVGSIIAATAGKYLKPSIMELGGKAPCVVLDDANIELAANNIVFGAMLNQGQICMSSERTIVSSNVHDKLIAAMQKNMETIKDKKFGLFSKASAEKARDLAKQTLNSGSSSHFENPHDGEGNQIPASLFSNVTRESKLWKEESFAPTISVIKVDAAGKSQEQLDAEMVELANDTPYGLSASVWSSDYARAMRVADGIEAGAVHINAIVPHGGWKSSGWGRFNSIEGLRSFTQTKSTEYCLHPHPYPMEIL